MTDKKFFKNFVTMLTGNTISQIIPFAVASILARTFLPSEFGLFSNLLALSTLFGIVSTGRLELAIPLPKEQNKAQDILIVSIIFTLFFTCLSSFLYFFAEDVGALYNDVQLKYYLFYIPICVLSIGALNLTNNWILRSKAYKRLSVIKIIQSVINNFGALILAYLGFGLHALILSWLASQFIPVVYILIKEKIKIDIKRFNFQTLISILKEYKEFPLINSIHAFTDIFATQVIIYWILLNFFGEDQLGLFTQMNKYIKAPIILVSSSVSQIFYVEVSKAIQEKRNIMPFLKQTIKTTLFFGVPFGLFILFFAQDAFSIFFGRKFIDYSFAGKMAQSILPILILMFVISPISGLPILFQKQKQNLIFALSGYVLGILGLFIGVLLKLDIYNTLIIYSLFYGSYYIIVFFWMRNMVMDHDNQLKY